VSRRVFVGDVQGCREPLERLLTAVGFRPRVDRLLPVGDLVNKGPDSPGTLALLMELGAEPVLGNHDLHWLRKARGQDPAQCAWLRAQPVARVFDDVIMVHAGLHPAWDEARLARLAPDEVDYAVNAMPPALGRPTTGRRRARRIGHGTISTQVANASCSGTGRAEVWSCGRTASASTPVASMAAG
jgi:hypothetical protein